MAGKNGWCRGEQTAGFSASDATSGLVTSTGGALSSPHAFTRSTTDNGSAVTIASGTIRDAAGNEATSVSAGPFKIDSVAPGISGTASPAPNGNGWNNESVTVGFTCAANGGSPVVSCGPDVTLADEGRAQSVTGDAEDAAGNTASDTVSGIDIDEGAPSAPAASFDRLPAFTDNGVAWFKGSFTASYGGSTDPSLSNGDAGSGIGGYGAADSRSTTGSLAYSGTATDRADNTSAATTGTVMVDADAPGLQLTGCSTGPVKVGTRVTLTVAAGDGAGSGLKTDPTGSLALDTASIGPKTRDVVAENNVGHTTTRTCSYRVIWDWSGFFQPVDMNGVLNRAKAGSAIPVKFSLDGAPVAGSNTGQGLAILVSEPATTALSCSGGTADEVEETLTSTNSGLKYDVAADQYVYVWKTASAWAGQCRQLIVKLADGTEQRANFQFVK